MDTPKKVGEGKTISTAQTKPGKKMYEKPRIIHRAPLEALAVICQPAPPGKAVIGVNGCTVTFS